MKIGFYLPRITHLKTMGKLIQESLTQGNDVVLLYVADAEKGAKAYQNVDVKRLKAFEALGATITAIRPEDIAKLRAKFRIDILCIQEGFYSLRKQLPDLVVLRNSGTKLASLSHFFENTKQPIESLEYFDRTFYLSEFAQDMHFDLHNSQRKKEMASYISVSGSPMFDQLQDTNRDQARGELGLPLEKKVVLLIDPVIDRATPWRFMVLRDEGKIKRSREAFRARKVGLLPQIWLGNTFRDVSASIKDFCEREDAFLIVKSRGKQADSKFLSGYSDMYINGLKDDYYPTFSTYKLLAAADLCITVNSMAAPEAVAAKVPCINIAVPHYDRAVPMNKVEERYYTELLGGAPDSLMNYSGCILKLDHRKARNWFRNHDMGDVQIDARRQQEYASKYLGIEKESSSARILADLWTL
jgi:hypothetical protein